MMLNMDMMGGGRRKSLSRRLADIFKAARTGIVLRPPRPHHPCTKEISGMPCRYRPGTGLVDPPVGLMLDKRRIIMHHKTPPQARPTLWPAYNLLTATETLSTQSVHDRATNYTLS